MDATNKDTRYISFILISFFFGSIIKSLYNFLIDLHVNFEDDLPFKYKKYKKTVHGLTDLFLAFLTATFIIKIANSATIAVYVYLFMLVICSLYLYMLFKSIKNT